MIVFGIIFCTLAGAACCYFLCGLNEEDNNAKGKDKNIGCIISLILAFLGTLLMFSFAALQQG
jgi:hypothetical protein